jgi:hypothetical protein
MCVEVWQKLKVRAVGIGYITLLLLLLLTARTAAAVLV